MKNWLYIDTPGTCKAIGLLILRLVVGTAFVLHGWPKIQSPMGWMGAEAPVPGILQACAALAEFGGGILLIIGLLTPVAALGIAGTMIVAIMFHMSQGDPFLGAPGKASYELAAGYLAAVLALLCLGPGRFSADALLFGSRSTPIKSD